MDTISSLLFLIVGLVAGALAAWFIAKSKFYNPSPVSADDFMVMQNARNLAEARLNELRAELESFRNRSDAQSDRITAISAELSKYQTINQALNEKLATQKTELEEIQKLMKQQFENIAGKIVFDQSLILQKQHTDKLNDLLNPLKEKIEKFESTVHNTHKESIRENQSLKEQLKQLQDLNKSIGEEARNLTTALKGQVKTQGNWGEMILETILEKSGLMRDREYVIQESHTSEDGRRLQPDVLVKLPENKTIIIDSKVSLIAYERFASSETPEEREAAMKEHLTSLRRHIRGLGEKKYQQLYSINSLDFVLLFIPVEPAFSSAIQHDPELFNDAFDSNIVIVSPSTLLATLRTIASIWKLEYQNKNALEIARQGGALYDKFVGFLEDFQKVGALIGSAQKSWDGALNKLSTGRGNLVTSVQKLQKLGATASKKIPSDLISDEADDTVLPPSNNNESERQS